MLIFTSAYFFCMATAINTSVAPLHSITLPCHLSPLHLLLKVNLMASFFTFVNKGISF